jgi:hypothetical protein
MTATIGIAAMIIIHVLAFAAGFYLVGCAIYSEIVSFILPRSARDLLTRVVFQQIRQLFKLRLRWTKTYEQRDRIMAFYAPFGLLALVPVWLALVLLGYIAMFWAVGPLTWDRTAWINAFRLSGSSLFTLGFSIPDNMVNAVLAFSEAAIGLVLVALFIAYLPTMYAAFSRREALVSLLEVRAGSPPSALEMLLRFNRIQGLQHLTEQWRAWEVWFADIQESHSSLPALVFFRSPQAEHSWVTAAGAILDAASLSLAAVDIPNDPQAALCIRAGYLALRRIADFFQIQYNRFPLPTDAIRIRRAEFDEALRTLEEKGVPLKADREQAWRDFAGWRVNYDRVLLVLARLVMAPEAPWSSDGRNLV